MGTTDVCHAVQPGRKLPNGSSWRLLLLFLSTVLLEQQRFVAASSSNVYNTTTSRYAHPNSGWHAWALQQQQFVPISTLA
jgi:hypothetical protein